MKYPDFKKKGGFKISGPCKAAARSKFDVYPSAYANAWGVRCTKAGGPGSMGKSKKKEGGFPDLTGDGKVTRADILKGRGVIKQGGGAAPPKPAKGKEQTLASRTPNSKPRNIGKVRTRRVKTKEVVRNEDGTYEIKKNVTRTTNRDVGPQDGRVGKRRAKAKKLESRYNKRRKKINTSTKLLGGKRKKKNEGPYQEEQVMAKRGEKRRTIEGKRRNVDVKRNKQVVSKRRETRRDKELYEVQSQRTADRSKVVSKKRAARVAGRINRRNERKKKTITR